MKFSEVKDYFKNRRIECIKLNYSLDKDTQNFECFNSYFQLTDDGLTFELYNRKP